MARISLLAQCRSLNSQPPPPPPHTCNVILYIHAQIKRIFFTSNQTQEVNYSYWDNGSAFKHNKANGSLLVSFICNVRFARFWIEMNGFLGHLCAHIGWTGPGEPPEDDEMDEMTLPSRHRIQNLSSGGLRLSTLPLGHGGSPQYWISCTSER